METISNPERAAVCQLPKELELLADVLADILARRYLKEKGIIN